MRASFLESRNLLPLVRVERQEKSCNLCLTTSVGMQEIFRLARPTLPCRQEGDSPSVTSVVPGTLYWRLGVFGALQVVGCLSSGRGIESVKEFFSYRYPCAVERLIVVSSRK